VGRAGDDSLFALTTGKVKFGARKGRKVVDVLPLVDATPTTE
jgi:large subunit ribosomal protein L27